MTKLSVIVIIYKVDKYLRKCIDSILSQSYENFELILVDDGSPDKCPYICDEYAKKDFRIKVIHQKNQGSVTARWNGLLVASGEYVSFVDGDDWLDADMYEKMMDLASQNESDIVITGYKEGTENSYVEKGNVITSGVYQGDEMQDIFNKALFVGEFYRPGIVPALWNKLFRRSLFFKEYIPAEPIIRMGEDAAVSYPMIARSKSVVIDNEFCPYHYRVVEKSMSRAYDERYFERCLALLEGLSRNLAGNQAMLNGLKFYSLFIASIGIERVCTKNSGLSMLGKKRILKKFQHQYSGLKIDNNYNLTLTTNKKWLGYFINGNIDIMLISIYIEKVLNKVEKLYGKEKVQNYYI